MSLINDALKKAQKQRTGETPSLASMPSVGGETPHRIAKRAKPAGFDTLIIRAGVGLGVVLVLAIGGWLALSPKAESGKLKAEDSNPQTAATSASAPNVGSPLVGGPSASPNPQVSASPQPASPNVGSPLVGGPSASPSPPASAPAPAFTLPTVQKPEPVAQVPVSEPQASRPTPQTSAPSPALTGSDPRVSPFSPPSASNPQLSAFSSQPSVSAVPPPKLEPRAIQFIENIKVAGIMARPTDSKVLMNDRVYRIGSLVEAEMGLTLVGITSNSLTFEDGNGGRYTRTF